MEYRRNLLTREWVAYSSGSLSLFLDNLGKQGNPNTQTADLFSNETLPCPYCPESLIDSNDIISLNYHSLSLGELPDTLHTHTQEWDVKVIPAHNPVFHIETPFNSKPRRLYDVMEAPGAHEQIIFTPNHYETLWDLPSQQIELLYHVLHHRMVNLYRDPKLGHQFAFMVFGQNTGGLWGHSVLNLTASPFVPLKIRQELDGAFQWFKRKERCIFSDIYEEEIYKRDKGQPNGVIFESKNYIAIIPFFSSNPFEIWIMPLDHYGSFSETPVRDFPELARVTLRIMTALRSKLGSFPFVLSVMNQPNEEWGAMRGYWKTLARDWLWRIRIEPLLPVTSSQFTEFNIGTGAHLNPIYPEDAARFIRQAI